MDIIEKLSIIILPILVASLLASIIKRKLNERKDFNDLIDPIRRELIGIKNNPRSGLTGSWGRTLSLIYEKLPFWRRKAFSTAVENYKKSKSSDNINMNVDGMGGWSYKDTEYIIHAVNDLLKYIKPK